MEGDFAAEGAIILDLSEAIAGDFVHFVEAVPREVDGCWGIFAVQTGIDATEPKLAASVTLEGDESRFEHIQILCIPEVRLDDPPFADRF